MKTNSAISAERLRELLDYDPATGVFVWRSTRKRVRAGMKAGRITSRGYLQITLDKRTYMASRLAWLYAHGVWPLQEMDHIDRDRLNNRIANLRDVDRTTNVRNTGARRTSRTGVLGVSPRANGRFVAQMRVGAKNHYLGYFDTVEAASRAYQFAQRQGPLALTEGTTR